MLLKFSQNINDGIRIKWRDCGSDPDQGIFLKDF